MIDVENIVHTTLKEALTEAYPSLSYSSEYVDAPAQFPAVTVVESDNRVYKKMSALEIENHAELTYDCNVYSNKASGRKTEAKAIAETLDTAFKNMGFTRRMKQPMPNLQDSRIYRIFLRYEGIVDTENIVYQG